MHPDDLASRGLSDGQRVRVSSRVGTIEVEVLSSLDMMKVWSAFRTVGVMRDPVCK